MARRKSRTVVLYLVPRRCSFPRADTYPGTQLQCRVSACLVMAESTEDRSDRTTFGGPNFSSAKSPIHIWETLRLEIAAPARRLFFRGALESNEARRKICKQ